MSEEKAPTTRLDRKIARRVRKAERRAELHGVRSIPVSGARLLLVAAIAVIVVAAAWWVNSSIENATSKPSSETTQATPSASSTIPAPTPTVTPSPDPNAVDREDPEAIARAWAEAYLVRVDPTDQGWKNTLYDFTAVSVVNQLTLQAFESEQILDGKAPTTLTGFEISDPAPDGVKNTPVRWSHTVTVNVTGEDASVSTIAFAIIMIHTRDGWQITSVEELSLAVTP